jgi:hypothetical protein
MGRNSARRGVDEMLANGDASCGIASIRAHARPPSGPSKNRKKWLE